jgi:hypothetical protein
MSNATSTKGFIVTTKRPLPADVRAWGRENDFPGKTEAMVAAETRGRLNPALRAAYNAKHKGANAYSEKDHGVKSVTVTAKPAKGRAKTAKVSVPEARKALAAQGVKVGKRGRLPQAALASLILS